MSSRHKYLSEQQRLDALCLRHSLDKAVALFKEGERSVAVLRQTIVDTIDSVTEVEIEYVEFVDDTSLATVKQVDEDVLIALAINIGRTRLIDNEVLRV
jgi:pantoate--beta-alanine ligase